MLKRKINENFVNYLSKLELITSSLELKMQEIYRPGNAISHASNLCTAVGGDQNKELRGNASFLREKGPRGGIKNILLLYFHIDQKAKNHMYSL